MNEKLRALHAQAQEKLNEAKSAMAAGEVEKAQAANTAFAEIKTQIETENRSGEVADAIKANSQWFSEPVNAPQLPEGNANAGAAQLVGFQDAGKTWTKPGYRDVLEDEGSGSISAKAWKAISQADYVRAFLSYIRKSAKGFGPSSDEMKILQEGIDDQGGFLVPADIIMRLITKKPAPTSTAAYVTTLDTIRDRVKLPKGVYTADNRYTSPVRVTWTGEIPASSTAHLATQPVFGEFECPVHTAMMSLPVTNDQLEDSGIALMAYIEKCFGEAVDMVQEDLILNGTGVKQPHGILANPQAAEGSNEPVYVNSGHATLLTADGLKSLQFALPPQYQAAARWVMSWTEAAQALEKLKDGEGRYIWNGRDIGISQSQFDLPLLGRPVSYNQFAPAIGAGTYPIVYGDLAAYYLVRRVGFSIQVLNELNALTNQKVLLGRLRIGGDVAEDWALKIQKVSA